MIRFIPILFLILIACLFGCDGDRATYDGIQAPPSTATTSVATEDIVAQRAAAMAADQVAKANLAKAQAEERAAKSDADRRAAEAHVIQAQTALTIANAKVTSLVETQDIQAKVELTGSFNRYLTLEIFIIIGIALMLYEKNTKAAGFLGIIGASLLVGVFAMDFAIQHEGLILGSATLIAAAIIVWHYRSNFGSAVAELRALEEAVGKSNLLLSIENAFHAAEVDAKTFLLHAWLRIKGWAVTAETKGAATLHLSGAVTVPSTPTPPASATGKV